MSRSYQYSYYNKNIGQKIESSIQPKMIPSFQQLNQSIQSLKLQLKQKQSLLTELSARLQQQQRLLEEKQFVIKQKELQLQYIHKENEELHDKIFQLNQRLNAERADIKDSIKQQVSLLKEEFNFMIKESQTKSDIIIQQKERQFKRKQQDLKTVIKELSERASSNNGSFYYEQSHSNIIKSKNVPNSYFSKRHQDFFQNQQEKISTANSNMKNSRESYRSTHFDNKMLGSLRQSRVGQNKDTHFTDKDKGTSSVSNLMNLRQGGSSQATSQVTGRFGSVKTPIMSKFSVRRQGQDRQSLSRASSRPNIQQIISRSKKELDERNKKSSMTDLPKHYPPLSSSSKSRLEIRRTQNLDTSKASVRYGIEQMDDKRKNQKLKEISSLKMKVNMLKTELKQEISFCQHKE